jgi:hypothetical protein
MEMVKSSFQKTSAGVDRASAPTVTEAGFARSRWGDATSAGYQVVPNVLIRDYRKLELDHLDVLIVLNITMHWWAPGALPYPRLSVIAKRLGVGVRTIQRRVEKLEERKLLERLAPEKRRGATVRRFRFTGLVSTLELLAVNSVAGREAAKEASAADDE